MKNIDPIEPIEPIESPQCNPILSELTRAKDLGYKWAQEAIDAFNADSSFAERHLENFYLYSKSGKSPISAALICGFDWDAHSGTEKWAKIYQRLLLKGE